MKWQIHTINDLCRVSGGKRLPVGHNFVTAPTNHPYIRITDMTFYKLSTENFLYISEETHKSISRYTISKDDIYISIAGTIGYVGKIPHFIDGANLTENCAKLSGFISEINRDYLMYYLRSPNGNGELLSRKGGASQPKLALERIKQVPVPVPPLAIQRRIADILSAYDDLIDNNQRQISLLEAASMRLYKEWFVNLRFPGHESTPIIDGVPKGWSKQSINDLMTFHRGYDLTKNNMRGGIIPVIGSTSVIGYHNEFKIKGPGIVTGRSGSLGTYQLVWEDFWPHNTSLYICDYKGHDIFYVFSLLHTVDFSSLNNGGAIPTLNRNTLSNIIVLEPDQNLQNKFALIAKSLYERIYNANKQITLLGQTRDKLLPKLMSGEIEV